MDRRIGLRREAGFTLLEILVGALVFMVGFSIAIGILHGALIKLHVDELTQAGAVGQMIMEQTVVEQDTTALDTVIIRNGRQLHVVRKVQTEIAVVAVDLTIGRVQSDRILLRWYHEYPLSAR